MNGGDVGLAGFGGPFAPTVVFFSFEQFFHVSRIEACFFYNTHYFDVARTGRIWNLRIWNLLFAH